MKLSNGITVTLLTLLVVSAILLLARSVTVGPESALRQQALRQVLAPANFSAPAAGDSDVERLQPVTSSVVNLIDIPANVYTPNNTYEKWLRGEIDLDEMEYRVSPAEVEALKAAALAMPPSPALQQAAAPVGPAPALQSSFDSLDAGDCCGGVGTSVPPDSHMVVGPDHIIAAVNGAFEIYDKSGASLYGPVTIDSFWSGIPACNDNFDPTVVYDEEADRYILGTDSSGTHFCIAVTQSGDPLGSWNRYAVPTAINGAFHDYPHLGVGEVAIFMGANQFGGSVPMGFEGRIWAFDKADMYAGDSMTPVTFSVGYDGGTPQPLNLHGYAQGTWPNLGAHYFVTDPYDGDTVEVWEWPDPLDGGTPSVVASFNLQTATGVTSGMPVDVPQQDGDDLQANDYRMRGLEYRNGFAWTTDTISCNPGEGPVNCVRWAQINLMTDPPTLVQAGVLASDDQYRTFSDLAVNHCNDMAVGYTKSNSSSYAGPWYTGRQSTDPLGTLQAEVQLKAGEKTYNSFDGPPYRWGDYSSMVIDPDGITFWYIGEYAKNVAAGPGANWGNYIGSFSYAECTGLPTYSATLGPDTDLLAPPATTIVHDFTLNNTGDSDIYNLYVTAGNWNSTLLTGSPLSVAGGMTATVSVSIEVPDMLSGSDTFTVTAASVSSPTLVLTATGTTTISNEAGVTLPDDMTGTADLDETITYTIAVTNTGTTTDTFSVSLGENNWPTTADPTSVGPLAAGASTTIEVYVVVGLERSDRVTVTVTSVNDAAVSDSVALTSQRAGNLFLPIIHQAP